MKSLSLVALALLLTSSFALADEAPAAASAAPAAEGSGLFRGRQQSLGGFVMLFNGDSPTGLTSRGAGRALGAEFSTYRGGNLVQLVGRARFQYGYGNAILQGESLSFKLTSAEALVGLRSFLLPGEFVQVRPYWGVGGKLALAHLQLSGFGGGPSSSLYASSTGKLLGTEFFTGVQLGEHAFFEFQIRSGSGSLGGLSSVDIGGVAISSGWTW